MRKKSLIAILVTILFSASLMIQVVAASVSLESIKNRLTFSVISDEKINDVTKDLNLPQTMSDAKIVWKSSDENLIRIKGDQGIVSRPPFGEGYAGVLLTAYIINDSGYAEKNFIISVKEKEIGYEYSSEITEAADMFRTTLLSKQNILSMTSDLIIPSIPENMSLTMYSDNTAVLDSQGKISRSKESVGSCNIYFVISCGYETLKMSFPIRVAAYDDEEIIQLFNEDILWVKAYMNTYVTTPITGNIVLPITAPNGSEIIWSSNSDAISSDGTIKRSEEDVTAELTATIKLDENAADEKFVVVIKKIAPENPNTGGMKPSTDGGSAGGGGGGGSGGSEPSEPDTPKPDVPNPEDPNVKPEDTETSIFKDVEITHWAYPAILSLNNAGIVSGYENLYRPNDSISREECVKIVVLALNIPLSETAHVHFDDVTENDWYYSYVISAYENGIVNGMNASEFGAGVKITRQDFATIVYNALKIQETIVEREEFSDHSEISDYAKKPVYALKAMSIINGRGDNRFAPKESISRAEAAQMIYKTLNVIRGN